MPSDMGLSLSLPRDRPKRSSPQTRTAWARVTTAPLWAAGKPVTMVGASGGSGRGCRGREGPCLGTQRGRVRTALEMWVARPHLQPAARPPCAGYEGCWESRGGWVWDLGPPPFP